MEEEWKNQTSVEVGVIFDFFVMLNKLVKKSMTIRYMYRVDQ